MLPELLTEINKFLANKKEIQFICSLAISAFFNKSDNIKFSSFHKLILHL